MTDICERLVRFAGKVCISTDTEVEAADIIEALRAENARLKEALKRLHEAARDIDENEMTLNERDWWRDELSHSRKVLENGDD